MTTTTSSDWALAGTLFALMIAAITAYAALLWYVIGSP
jgi:hypothetical protein